MIDKSERAEKMWARKVNLDVEGKGTAHVVAYYGFDIWSIKGVTDRQALYARCPFCKTLNSSEDYDGVRSHTSCKHFVEVMGGCGMYSFVFSEKEG